MSALGITQDIQTSRSRVRVRTLGAGEPVLLLHGVLSDAEVWKPLADELAQTHLCVIPDLTGFGQSDRPGLHHYAYGEDAWPEDAFDVLTALGLPRAHVIGFAEGGHVAVRLASRAPSTVISMASLASPLWSTSGAKTRASASVPLWGRLALMASLRSRDARGDVTTGSMSDARGREVVRRMLRAGRDERTLRAALATLQTPLLIVLDAEAPDQTRVRIRLDTAGSDRVRVVRETSHNLRRGELDAGLLSRIREWLDTQAP